MKSNVIESHNRLLISILLILGRLALAAIFLLAAYAKLKPQAQMSLVRRVHQTSLSLFAMQVDSYQLLPPQLVSPAAQFASAVRIVFRALAAQRSVSALLITVYHAPDRSIFHPRFAPIAWDWKSTAAASARASG